MREAAIGDVCELINGRAFKPSDWTADGLPIVRIQNLNDEVAPFNRYNGPVRERFLIDSGALLFSWSGTPGTSFGAFFWHRGPAILNQHIFHVLPRSGVDKNYLRYALNGRIQRIIAQAHGGVGLQHITKDKLEATTIPLLPFDEQRRIADILDKADAIRRKRKQAIALTEELLRSAFLEMFGDPVMNPKGWPMSTFGAEVSLLEYGPRFYNEKYSDDGMRIVRITDLDLSGALDFKSMPRLIVDARDQERYLLRPGDVIFARSGATVGKTALSKEGDPPAIPGAYFIRLRFKDTVLPRYARQVLASESIQQIVVSRSRQSAQQNFSGPGIRELPLPLPPRKTQERLESVARGQICQLGRLRSAQEAADTLFSSIVARAFSGDLTS